MKEKGVSITNQELLRYEKAKTLGKKTVLFICTANAVRSQMAEALVNHFLGDHWAAFSAGLMPIAIHPLVVKVLQEIGVDPSSQKAKHIDTFKDFKFNKVITLCSQADEICTYYPGLEEKEHFPFQDPALLSSSIFGRKGPFRILRDEMKKFLIGHLKEEIHGKIS